MHENLYFNGRELKQYIKYILQEFLPQSTQKYTYSQHVSEKSSALK